MSVLEYKFLKINNTNKFKVYLITFISNFILFYSPIIFLFYKNFGIDIFKIGIIFSVTSISNIIFEIPFGLFADKKSPKLSVCIGSVMITLSLVGLFFSTSFFQFLICAIFMAVGDAGMSGANSVLLMNLLEREEEVFEISSISSGISNILGGLIIGFIYNINVRLPFLISMVLSILNLFLYLSISEKHINTEKEKVQIENVNFKTAFFIFKKQVFIFLILLLSYISIPQVAIYFPEYLDFFKINSKYIGIMYMIANIISMFGTKFHQIYLKKYNPMVKLKYCFLFLMISTFVMWISKNFFVSMFFYAIYRFITGYFYLLFSMYINSKTDLHYKSTILSIKNVIVQIAFILSDPLVTFIIKEFGISRSYCFAFISITVIFLIVLFYKTGDPKETLFEKKPA